MAGLSPPTFPPPGYTPAASMPGVYQLYYTEQRTEAGNEAPGSRP